MSRKLFFLFVAISAAICSFAQQAELIVSGASPDLYLQHTVAAKENLYSIGRLYNQGPKLIAQANNMKLDGAIQTGQKLKIPLTTANFSQDGRAGSGEVLVPALHVVAEKEWLYRISVAHNKVPVSLLEKWNNTTNDNIKPGMKLIVGYLKVKSDQSALASNAAPPDPKAKEPDPIRPVPARDRVERKDTLAAVREPDPIRPAPAREREEKRDTPVVVREPDPIRPVPARDRVEDPPHGVNRGGEGFFKAGFGEQSNNGRNTTNAGGACNIFKTVSGWEDGKYYAMIDKVQPGTIIKVVNPANNKTIYAKVLGELHDIKLNEGLLLRISNAAASELGLADKGGSVEVWMPK